MKSRNWQWYRNQLTQLVYCAIHEAPESRPHPCSTCPFLVALVGVAFVVAFGSLVAKHSPERPAVSASPRSDAATGLLVAAENCGPGFRHQPIHYRSVFHPSSASTRSISRRVLLRQAAPERPAHSVSVKRGYEDLEEVCGRKLLRLLNERKSYALGLDGELATAEELNQLMRDGCRVFHDIPFRHTGTSITS